MNFQSDVDQLIETLRFRGELPLNMDIAQIGPRYWFVSYDDKPESIVSELSTTGLAETPIIAMLKSLSERAEREAFREGYVQGLDICQTDRSDGFAAYPRFYPDAEKRVRESALAEAIERYVWAKWWDNQDYAYETLNISNFYHDEDLVRYVSKIEMQCGVQNIHVIIPKIENANGFQVMICIGELRHGGFVSGGACGLKSSRVELSFRALDELYRHGLAIKRMKRLSLKPETFYERRLSFFGGINGEHLVRSRIGVRGSLSVILPELVFDSEVQHKNSDIFIVHRCLFKNQPPFMGGDLKRFCI